MIQLSYSKGDIVWRYEPCYDRLWGSSHTAPQIIHLLLRRNCDKGTLITCTTFVDWLAQYAPISLHTKTVEDLFMDKTYTVTYVTLETIPDGNAYVYYTVLSLCRFLTREYNPYLPKRASPQRIIERVFSKDLRHPLGLHLPAQDHYWFIKSAKTNIQHLFSFYSYMLATMPMKPFKFASSCCSGITNKSFLDWLSTHVTLDVNPLDKETNNA